MSLTAMDKPLVKSLNYTYSKKLLEYNNFNVIATVGVLHKVEGFDDYNQLLNINTMFSNRPMYDPVDRTLQAQGAIRYANERPWTVPTQELTLEQALESRVVDLCRRQEKINLLWSGGIDSTAIVVAFLQYAPDLAQCRIVYSPWSVYEHPDFFKMLSNRNDVELVDISGEFYLTSMLDGIFVSGNSSDEIHASIDESFFTAYSYDFLFTPWKDFFYSKLPDDKFIEFCEKHFSVAGKNIHSILDARWWFYTSTKLTSLLYHNNLSFCTAGIQSFDPAKLIGFFDCDEYEQFIYFNIDKIIESSDYASWRQFLKDFCCRFDGFEDWRKNKAKFGSNQLQVYTYKKQILNDARSLMLLDNGERVATPNLPLLSKSEWDQISHQYQHVFRQPDTI